MNMHQVQAALRGGGTWMGFFDIIVVAYLIYRLLLLVRGTRALQILGGLGTLVFALYISERLHLDTLNWLLKQVVPLGPVAIVILFYPELRHALEEFGPRFWSRGLGILNREDVSDMINTIVLTVNILSAKRLGALIVFERVTGLDEIIQSGTRMDALVSVELLETIFYKGTALHDGAVVVRNGRHRGGGVYASPDRTSQTGRCRSHPAQSRAWHVGKQRCCCRGGVRGDGHHLPRGGGEICGARVEGRGFARPLEPPVTAS